MAKIVLKVNTTGSSTWFGDYKHEFDTLEEFIKFIKACNLEAKDIQKLGRDGILNKDHTHGLYSTQYVVKDLAARIWCEKYTETKEAIDLANRR